VYLVSTWTENLTGCAAEGTSVASQRSANFYIKAENFLGVEFINFKSCDGDADCKMLATEPNTINLGEFGFEEGSDSDGWRSRSATGFEFNGACMAYVTETVLTSPASGQLRIEARRTDAPPFAPDAQGECPDAAVEAAVVGQPCSDLEVVTGAKTGDF
jgi:hypothetical protein